MILKCIQCIMKENLLLLKDLLEHWKTKFTNILLQYQMYYFSIYWCKNNKENQEGFVVKKFKNTLPWTYVIYNLNSEEIVGAFYEKELQKKNQSLELKK